jgi:ribonuclease HII
MAKLPPLPEIEAEALKEKSPSHTLEFLKARLKDDARSGAQRLLAKYEKSVHKEEKEKNRQEALLKYEREAKSKGFQWVAGVDEAGRGPLAGPVVAAAVILSPGEVPAGVDDSKKLSHEKREELFPKIQEKALGVGVGQASVQEIDELNIYRAAQLAMERAIKALDPKPDYLLTDAMPLPSLKDIPQKPIVHGDALSFSIAAASIVAKVTRDRLMADLHQRYSAYGFDKHKGYGTEEHLKNLEAHGPCPEHRLSFRPVLEILAQKSPGGTFGFWKEKLSLAATLVELQQVGLQVKRAAITHLSTSELDQLRALFRLKRDGWENQKA